MHQVRVYVDTSVFGGVYDDEFARASKAFFAKVRKGKYIVLVSRTTANELRKAPKRVQSALMDLPEESVEIYQVSEEADELAQAYIAAGALDKGSYEDATHVAVATVTGADLIQSWNFKHIVNYDRILKFNSVNLANSYRPIEIRSPLEVAYDDEEEESL